MLKLLQTFKKSFVKILFICIKVNIFVKKCYFNVIYNIVHYFYLKKKELFQFINSCLYNKT